MKTLLLVIVLVCAATAFRAKHHHGSIPRVLSKQVPLDPQPIPEALAKTKQGGATYCDQYEGDDVGYCYDERHFCHEWKGIDEAECQRLFDEELAFWDSCPEDADDCGFE